MSTGGEKERDDVLAEHETDTESDGEEFSGGDSGGDSDGDSDSSEGLALVASVNGGAAPSGATKRAREESNEASASGAGGGKQEEGDGDSDNDNDSVGEVTVDFQFQDPREIHYLSVKRLLGGLLPGTTGDKFAVHELADAIVNQAAVGTMVTADETGDAYAFITAINFNLHKVLLRFSVSYSGPCSTSPCGVSPEIGSAQLPEEVPTAAVPRSSAADSASSFRPSWQQAAWPAAQ